jgi:hypothetical protein
MKEDSILPAADSSSVITDSALDCKQTSSASQMPAKPDRLWKNACISTAANVQKALFCWPKRFCPRSIQLPYNVFPAHPAARKPLTL